MAYGFNDDKSKEDVYAKSDVITGWDRTTIASDEITIAAGREGDVYCDLEPHYPKASYKFLNIARFKLIGTGAVLTGVYYDYTNNRLKLTIYNATTNSIQTKAHITVNVLKR